MLSSPFLSLKKGPFGVIWVAAYFAKRLSKHQVTEIDIPSSVDKILIDEWPSVSYRILAYLLLGLVRIFSKKVEYVLSDCHGIVNELNNFVSNKRATSFKDVVRLPKFSITLPERYELDAFILEVPDDMDREHVAQEEDIVLKAEAFQRDGFSDFSFDKLLQYHRAEASGKTPATEGRAVTSSCRSVGAFDLGIPPYAAVDRSFSLKRIHSSRAVRTIEDSLEELERIRFPQEECLDFQMFFEQNEADNREILNSSSIVASNVEHIDESGEVQVEYYDGVAEEDEEMTVQRSVDAETPLENQDPEAAQNKDVCFTMKGTPETSVSCPFVATTPEVMILSIEGPSTIEQCGVKTPANKERPRRPQKLRCLYDEIMVLSRKSLKRCIDDATDLTRKRRKGHNILDVWRSSLISSFLPNFSAPLIPWSVTELPKISWKGKPVEVCQVEVGECSNKSQSLVTGADQVEVGECSNKSPSSLTEVDQVEVGECSNKSLSFLARDDQVEEGACSKKSRWLSSRDDLVEMGECYDKSQSSLARDDQVEMGECSDKTRSSLAGVNVQSDIAPGTPVPCLASSKVFKRLQAGELDAMKQSKSSGSYIRKLSVEVVLPDWTNEVDQSEGDVQEESHGLSRRTRNFASCLHQFFMNKGNHEEEDRAMNLSNFLQDKLKKESARLFYEILVLKSGGYVIVKQDAPYSNIIVRKTPKWKQLWETPTSSQPVF